MSTTAFSKTLRAILRLLGTTRERVARATMMLPAEVSALSTGGRRANFQDVKRLGNMLPDDHPEWKAALFHSYLEDEYGPEWADLLPSPAAIEKERDRAAHSNGPG